MSTILCLYSPKEKKAVLCSDGRCTNGTVVAGNSVQKIHSFSVKKIPFAIGFSGGVSDHLFLLDKLPKYLRAELRKKTPNLTNAIYQMLSKEDSGKCLEVDFCAILLSPWGMHTFFDTGAITEHPFAEEQLVLRSGSGAFFAEAAARGIWMHDPDAEVAVVAEKAMQVAGSMDVFSNTNISTLTLSLGENETQS